MARETITETPQEAFMFDRLSQANHAPGEIKMVHMLREDFDGVYCFDQIRDGVKTTIEIDEQVEKAMKGAEMGILQELRSEGVVFDRENLAATQTPDSINLKQ